MTARTLFFNTPYRPSRQRVAEHRARLRQGYSCFLVTIDGAVLDLPIRRGHLRPADATVKRSVEDALSQYLASEAVREI
jgi:hypothetical protein